MGEQRKSGRMVLLDPVSGVSGDMLLGALVDCGVSVEDLNTSLRRTSLDGVEYVARKVRKGAVSATKVDVMVGGRHADSHHCDGAADHGDHRGLPEVVSLLEASSLPRDTIARAKKVFGLLAEAEGRIHGIPPETVHFHEVGAVDAIADIVGVVEGLRMLGAGRILCGPLPLAGGETTSAHGMIPLPAPATLELLKGFPTREAPGRCELVTPTGAALVQALAEPLAAWPRMIPCSIGYGAGARDPAWPNVLRLVVGDEWARATGAHDAAWTGEAELAIGLGSVLEEALLLECNVDDMNPQIYEHVQQQLFSAGAMDVYLTPVQMKKQRPGVLVSVVVPAERLMPVLDVLFRETTTIGVRGHRVTRWVADREIREVRTPYGGIRIKCAYLGGKVVNAAPEYEDCKRAAASHGVPLKVVIGEALKATFEQQCWAGRGWRGE
ncbi:MAG: nickel pincer cofactor biosynthesis protein LarC [Ignavibacteriales bacterium]